jgi:hypothetical protein
MSNLIDTLRSAVEQLPASHQPANVTDAIGLVGSLIAYVEHGAENFVSAVEHGNVASLYKDAEQLAAGATEPASIDEAYAEIASLKQQLAAAQAVAQLTTVTSSVPAVGA